MVSLHITAVTALLFAFMASASPVGQVERQVVEERRLPLPPPPPRLLEERNKQSGSVYPRPPPRRDEPAPAAPAPAPIKYTSTGSSENIERCTSLALLWFRSADQPQDALGKLGDVIYPELLKYEKDTAVYNVIYDAQMYEEFFSNKAAGADATNFINRKAAECPEQRYMIGGYSKGALGVHLTFPAPEVRKRVVATLTIGDPLHKRPLLPFLASNASWPSETIKTVCNVNDLVCWPNGTDIRIHGFLFYIDQIPALVKDYLIEKYQAAIKK